MRVAVVGTGVIGRGWIVCFLGQGHDVVAHDPRPGSSEITREFVAQEWATAEALGLAEGASPDRLSFSATVAGCVTGADFVQENGPETLALKTALLAEIDRHVDRGVVIASSSSGLGPTQLSSACVHPERVLVGHPFSPAHIIPLVEVVAGAGVGEDAVRRALAVYSGIGKRPIHVRAELPGHVVNRLQAALWQEAYSLVQRGVVTVAEVDAAVAYGPGLRWALAGPILNQHLAGGDGGLAHVLEHLGPAAETWMDDLGHPRLDTALSQRLVDGVHDEIGNRDERSIAAERDSALLALLAVRRATTFLP